MALDAAGRGQSNHTPSTQGFFMFRFPLLSGLLGFLAMAVFPTAVFGQAGSTARPYAGGDLIIAAPVGPFKEVVGGGVGFGMHGGLPLGTSSILSIRGDLGFVNYGNETIPICVTQPCRVTGDLTTSNNILFMGIGPELAFGDAGLRGYLHGGVGFAYFATTSSVRGSGNQGEPFASSTNYDDLTLAFLGGGGLLYQVGGTPENPVFVDLGARYHHNGEAEYLRKGDIQDRPDGSVVVRPRRSETNLWAFRIGIRVGLGPTRLGR
jgi:hypothetical protein